MCTWFVIRVRTCCISVHVNSLNSQNCVQKCNISVHVKKKSYGNAKSLRGLHYSTVAQCHIALHNSRCNYILQKQSQSPRPQNLAMLWRKHFTNIKYTFFLNCTVHFRIRATYNTVLGFFSSKSYVACLQKCCISVHVQRTTQFLGLTLVVIAALHSAKCVQTYCSLLMKLHARAILNGAFSCNYSNNWGRRSPYRIDVHISSKEIISQKF